MSGSTNAGDPFDLVAARSAADSTYAGIVRLVEAASASRAPMARLADRYAIGFLGVTLVMAGVAWFASGDAVRALAVLVVATPCPLILAVPVAIISGVSRAARAGVLVKGGGALERLAAVKVVLFDKTGTVTAGHARLTDIKTPAGVDPENVLRLAASLDQGSHHVIADALVHAARERGLGLDPPTDVREEAGAGIAGLVGGRAVVVGGWDFVRGNVASAGAGRDTGLWLEPPGTVSVVVAIDGAVAGVLLFADEIRPDAAGALAELRGAGVDRAVLVTGDRKDVARRVGAALGVDDVLSEMTPSDKVAAVRREQARGPVMMVGDGVNDAPALAAADVGVAMGARGATASSEAADVVLIVDRLDRIAEAISIARRSRRIAEQSVVIGMGLAFGGMLLGAFGLLVPVAGAIVQECIDVFAILNALRALRGEKQVRRVSPSNDVADRFRFEHKEFAPEVLRIRTVADRLGQMTPDETRQELEAVRHFLLERLPEHEEEEEAIVYPVVAQAMGGEDPMSSMNRAHLEIAHLGRIFQQLVEELPVEGPSPEDMMDLRRVLYGLHAILRLHFAQEEEAYAWLASSDDDPSASAPVSVSR
jgi:heavy metal translocating P-type ATPase